LFYALDIQGITDPFNAVQGNLIQENLIMAFFTTCMGFNSGSFYLHANLIIAFFQSKLVFLSANFSAVLFSLLFV
jgi:hypothetical protein